MFTHSATIERGPWDLVGGLGLGRVTVEVDAHYEIVKVENYVDQKGQMQSTYGLGRCCCRLQGMRRALQREEHDYLHP